MTSEKTIATLHDIVCRARPEGTAHSFAFDPQGILSDCRFLLTIVFPAAPPVAGIGDAERLARLAEAAEEMRLEYNRALEKHGDTNPVLRDLRHAIGHLAVTREAYALRVAPAARENGR